MQKDPITPVTNTQPIKLIAVDLDGTLLNSQHEMTPRTEETMKKAIAAGIQVVIATGKTLQASDHLFKRLNLKAPGIFVQGTVIYNTDGSLHSQQTINTGAARQIITFAEDRGFQLAVYSGNRILVRKLDSRMEELTMHYHEPMPQVVGPLQNVLDNTAVNKIIAIYPEEARKIQALRWQLTMQVTNIRLMSAGIADEIEILPANASKGAALKTLAKELGIPSNQVLAIGDGENDIEMLQWAGTGVAVGNAAQHIKEIAKAVVASNNEDGVAEAVERFVLNTKPAEPTPETPAPATSQPQGSSSNGGPKA